MQSLIELFSNPLVWKVVISYWLFSAVVGAMPTPDPGGSKWYVFLFRLAHGIGGNLNRAAMKLNVPGAVEDPKV
jgi:hypothetical protein